MFSVFKGHQGYKALHTRILWFRIAHFAYSLSNAGAIYRQYYEGQEKQFLQLLELVATHSLPQVCETIAQLERIPTTVSTEKIKLILEKKDEPVPILAPSAITRQAKETVSQYSRLLGGIPV